jgi:hypothetical protein
MVGRPTGANNPQPWQIKPTGKSCHTRGGGGWVDSTSSHIAQPLLTHRPRLWPPLPGAWRLHRVGSRSSFPDRNRSNSFGVRRLPGHAPQGGPHMSSTTRTHRRTRSHPQLEWLRPPLSGAAPSFFSRSSPFCSFFLSSLVRSSGGGGVLFFLYSLSLEGGRESEGGGCVAWFGLALTSEGSVGLALARGLRRWVSVGAAWRRRGRAGLSYFRLSGGRAALPDPRNSLALVSAGFAAALGYLAICLGFPWAPASPLLALLATLGQSWGPPDRVAGDDKDLTGGGGTGAIGEKVMARAASGRPADNVNVFRSGWDSAG